VFAVSWQAAFCESHKTKPECAYQMLETFFPQAKKLELFARAERDGWDQWGNEL
jgi:N6-adenosine-specific RNA methylase IME4